jgi:enoyl-CoA hydratase/3-hydroxyacyl-CoA dehydrogenase
MPKLLAKQRTLGKPFDFSFVDLKINGAVASVTLNRPEVMNALNETVIHQLDKVFSEAENIPEVKAVVFQGAGKAFVAGADIRYFVQKIKEEKISDIVAFTRKSHELLLRIENSKKLTIAVLDGLSLGGGSELALACQAIIATPAGSMAFPETGIGIYPGLGGMFRLARHVGTNIAKYYVLTGATLHANDAKDLGIITRLVEPSEVASAITTLVSEGRAEKYGSREIPERFRTLKELFQRSNADMLIKGELPDGTSGPIAAKTLKDLGYKAPLALKIANEIMDEQVGKSILDAIEIELGRLLEIFATADALEGLSALGRRRPEFKGK